MKNRLKNKTMTILKNVAIDSPPSWKEDKRGNGLKFQKKKLELNENQIFLPLGVRKQRNVLGWDGRECSFLRYCFHVQNLEVREIIFSTVPIGVQGNHNSSPFSSDHVQTKVMTRPTPFKCPSHSSCCYSYSSCRSTDALIIPIITPWAEGWSSLLFPTLANPATSQPPC